MKNQMLGLLASKKNFFGMDLEGWKTMIHTKLTDNRHNARNIHHAGPTNSRLILFFAPGVLFFPTRSHFASCWAGVGF